MGPALWGCALALRERAILLSVTQKWAFPVPLRKGRTFLALGPPVPSDWGILWLHWDMHLGLHSRKGPFWLGPDDFPRAPVWGVSSHLWWLGHLLSVGRPLLQGQGSLLHDGSGTKTMPTEALKRCC